MVKAKQLTLELNLNDKATKELIDFAKKLEGTGKKGKKTGKDIERGFKRGSKAVKGLTTSTKNATKGMGGMLVKVASLTAAFRLLQAGARKGFSFIEQASKFEEEIAKFGVVFGQEAERVAESLDEMSGAMNRSRGELVAFASSFQDIFVPLGFARKEASDLSLKLTELAIDVGSFNNRLDTDVIRDFQSALVGSSITVRKYGILIDQARINQVGWALGLAKQGDELTAQQRVIARYNILLQDSADAVGDAVRTADSFANTMKGLSAQISDTGIVFGQELQVAVLETIESMGGIEGVVDVVKVGFAAITTGTEFLIRTTGKLGASFKELFDGIGGADKAVALIRGEFELTEEAGKDLAVAVGHLDRLFVAAFDVLIASAALAGDSVATGFFTALGLNFDREARKFLVVYGDFARDWAQGNPVAIPEFVIGVAAAGGLKGFTEKQIQKAADAAEAGGGVTAESFVASLNRELTSKELNLERLLFATKQGGDSFKPGSVENLVRREFKLDPAAVEEMESTARATLKGMLDSVAEVGPSSPAGDKLREVIQQSLHMEGLEPSFKDSEARLQELYTQLAAAGSGEVFREELAKGSEGLYQPLIDNLRSDDAERVAAQSKAKLEAILTDLRNVGADVELITIGRGRGQQQVIKFSDAFRADPNANKDAIAVLTKYLDPGAIQQAVADKLKPLDQGSLIPTIGSVGTLAMEPFVLKLEDIVDETGLERELREKEGVFKVALGDVLEGVSDFAVQAMTDLKPRDLSIADFINMDSSADQTTVLEVARRFSTIMNKVGVEIANVAGASEAGAVETLKVNLAPAFEEEMFQVLRDAEEFGVKLPAAVFDAVIDRARDLGIEPDVISQWRVLAAGLVQETKKIVDGVTDAGGQLKINFGLIGKDSSRAFLTEFATMPDFDDLAGLESFAARAEEMGLKIAPSLVEPLRQHIKAFGLEEEYEPVLARFVAANEDAALRSMAAFGAARVIMDATVEIEKLKTDDTKTDEEVAKLVKGLQDRIQLSLGKLESLNLNEEQLLALGALIPELIAKGAIDSDALEGAAATVLETLQAEFATLQAELAAGLGGVTGEQTLEAKLRVDIQAVTDDTTTNEDQKARKIDALTASLALFKDAQVAATASVHAALRASAEETTTLDATVKGIEQVAIASKLAAEAKLKAGTITAEDLRIELDLHDKIRGASLKTAGQAESVRRATETLEAARSAVASGLGDNAAVVAAQRALNDATVAAVKGISDDERATLKERLNSALNIQIALQENLNAVRLKGFEVDLGSVYEQEIAGINAAAEAAIRAAEALVTGSKLSVDAKNAEVEAINSVRDAQLELAEDFALGDSLQRAASLAAELGTAFDIQRQAAISAAQAAETLAIASAGTSDLARENLQRELELLDLKLARTLKFIGLQERGAKGAKVWGDLLGDQEAGLKLQADLAGAFDTAVGGLARSFVDASTSWADFRDQFLMSIAQMIVKALLLASIEATIRAFSFGTFASGGVAEGVDTNAMGGVTTGVGSMSTGPAPRNFFAMGGVQGGTMKAHSDGLGFERGAKTVKAFADGGIMEGVGSHMPVSAFANGGVMGGLPVHQYAIGGIARTPQLAVFGEGRGAEAFVPLPDGKSIPVKMDGSSGPISVNLTVASLDPRTAADVVLAQMPKIRKELAAALREGTDRSLTEGVRGAARR